MRAAAAGSDPALSVDKPAAATYLICMTEIVFLVEPDPEGGLVARALGHSIFTQADDEAELREMVREAVRCHFDEPDRPKVIRLHFVRDEVLTV